MPCNIYCTLKPKPWTFWICNTQPTGQLVDFGVIRLFLLLGLQEVKARCTELFALDQPLDPSQIIQLEASALTSSSSFVSEVRKNICKKGGGEDIVRELELGNLQTGAKDTPLGSKMPNSVPIFALFGAVISVLLAVLFALFLMRFWRSWANFFLLIKSTHYPKCKCSNNFVFVCKKFYVSSVFFELNSPVGTYVVSNLAHYEILNSHLSFNNAHNLSGERCGPHLPFLCVVWKFHKNLIKPRFICEASLF